MTTTSLVAGGKARPVPTWRLALLAAAGGVVVLLEPFGAAATLGGVNAVLAVAAVVAWVRAPRPARLQLSRDLPGVVTLGEQVEVVWTVANPTPRSVRVRLADELAPSLRASTRRVSLSVPAGGRAVARAQLRPYRRGRFTPTAVTLRVERPGGLVARQAERCLPADLRVYPPFRSRQEAELRVTKARILEVGLRSAAGRGGGTDFDQLREYRVDDEFRRIDWAATARTGRPIVRTYRAERNQTVLCLLDTGRVMAGRVRAPDAGDVPRLDHAMDAVMMLTAMATRLGDRTGLVAFADHIRRVVAPSHRRGQLSRITESLYDLDPLLVESDYRTAFAETLARFRRRTLLVVITDLAEQPVAETLLPALPLVARDHAVIVAGLRDPQVHRWARAAPADAAEAYRKAAAVQTLDARRRTVARLRGLGAAVVDAPPGELAGRLADSYLHLKATARL